MAKAPKFDTDTVGNVLFGSGLRLKVMSWLALRDDPRFYADQYAKETGHYSSQISKVCQRLSQLDMVEKEPLVAPAPGTPWSGRCVYWRRLESPLWDVVKAAVRATETRLSMPPTPGAIDRARRHLMIMEKGLR